MKNTKMIALTIVTALASAALLLAPNEGRAHCDGPDEPVVAAAGKALKSGDVKLVLAWVQKTGEAEIKSAFRKTLFVRKLDPQAKELADTYFFETLVRVHRAGESEPYTGLRPAGCEPSPARAYCVRREADSLEPVMISMSY